MTRTDVHSSRRHAEPCHCGCAPCKDEYCELECQMRPRFVCGQLLTDDDLTTMVQWTAGKFRLQRFRDGWGVACGLNVRCDPDNPNGVIVGEGYAVSCCGDDIVVCAEEKLDLQAAWPETNPCEDPEATVEDEAESERRKRSVLSSKVGQGDPAGGRQAVLAEMGKQLTDAGEQDASASALTPTVRWVDVFVRYREEDADPRATLRHSDCVEAPDCEAAKTREAFTLYWELGSADPDKTRTEAWCRDYKKCLDVLHQFADRFGDRFGDRGYDWLVVRQWLLDWIARNPPQVYCDLHELICGDDLEQWLPEILARLVLDCRGAYTRNTCYACERATGVRLARVYLGQPAADGPRRVRYIDNYPPFRRRLSRTSLPAPVGATNIGSLIGARWAEACRHLADLGIQATRVPVDLQHVETVAELLDVFECDCDPIVECGQQRVTVQVVRFSGDWFTDEIVVGFCETGSAAALAPQEAAAPDVSDTPEEGSDTIERERLKKIRGVGDVIADRLVEEGLTLETIATEPDVLPRLEKALPAMPKARVSEIVAEARRIWEADSNRHGGS